MNNASIRLIDLAGVIGGLTLTFFGVAYVAEKFPLRIQPPSLPPSTPSALPPGPAQPILMTGAMLELFPGRRYGVALDTPALLPTSDSQVKEKARELGFTNVDVFSKPPPGWPGKKKSDADTWIVGFYSGAPKKLPRSHSTPAGSIDVIEAWEG